jgi:hypothetical protein
MINLKRLVRVLGDQPLSTMRVASDILREPWVDDGPEDRGHRILARGPEEPRGVKIAYTSGTMVSGECELGVHPRAEDR